MRKKVLCLCLCLMLVSVASLAETVSILFPAEDSFYKHAAETLRDKLTEKGIESAIIYYASEEAIIYDGSTLFVICAGHFPEAISEDAFTLAFLCDSEKADCAVIMDEYLTGAALMKMVLARYNGARFALEYAFSEEARMFYLGARDVLQPYINRAVAKVLCGEAQKESIFKRVRAITLAHSEDHLPLTVFCDSDRTISEFRKRFDGEAWIPSRKDVWQYDINTLSETAAEAIGTLLSGGECEKQIVLAPSALMEIPSVEITEDDATGE